METLIVCICIILYIYTCISMLVEYKMQWNEIMKFVVNKNLNENAFQSGTIDEEPPYII